MKNAALFLAVALGLSFSPTDYKSSINLRDYYFPFEDFTNVVVYKFQEKKDPSSIHYWHMETQVKIMTLYLSQERSTVRSNLLKFAKKTFNIVEVN